MDVTSFTGNFDPRTKIEAWKVGGHMEKFEDVFDSGTKSKAVKVERHQHKV